MQNALTQANGAHANVGALKAAAVAMIGDVDLAIAQFGLYESDTLYAQD